MQKVSDFIFTERERQIEWRKKNISSEEWGFQNKKQYPHIVPKHLWMETVWKGIRTDLKNYLKDKEIHPHTGTHNLCSSWVVCANLYFPIRNNISLRKLMAKFLSKELSQPITEVIDVELEFALAGGSHPSQLLGEEGGSRGSGQTSPDVAFILNANGKKCLILTECKYTEHSFYSCSARTMEDSETRKANPHPEKCMIAASGYDYKPICHQTVWGRKYWSHIQLSDEGKKQFSRCPAATAGYQLFRQQALASGILKNADFDIVASTVSFDSRNEKLLHSLKATGVSNFKNQWGLMFDDQAIFKAWTHQDWVEFVRTNQVGNEWNGWLQYLADRYGY